MDSIQEPMRGSLAQLLPTPQSPSPKGGEGDGEPGESSVSLGKCISRGSDLEAMHSKDRPGLQDRSRNGDLSGRDSPEVARRGTEAMHERPSRYPHSPNSRQNQEGTASHADTQQRAEAIQSHIPDKQTASLWLTRQWQAPKFRSRAPAWEPSTCDSPEVARRGTKAQRERPSRNPHSPNIQETRLGTTPHAEALQRSTSINESIQHPGTADSKPMPTPAPRPTAPYGGVVAGGVQGCRVQSHGMAGSQPAAHGTNLKPKHTHPKFGAAGRVPRQID